MEKRRIAILGSTGSIGRQALDVIRQHRDLFEVELLTGRHHQIRCQLADIGCPIKGDLKYGAPRSNKDGGISLYAKRVEFVHPVRREPVIVEVPTPIDDTTAHIHRPYRCV